MPGGGSFSAARPGSSPSLSGGDLARVWKPTSLSDRENEATVHRKLEGYAYQYSELLAGQLQAQRLHFESQLAALRVESDARAAERASYGMLMSKVRAMAGVAGATIETLDSLASKGTPIPLVTLPCGHVFHERCLRGWAIVGKQDTCP